MLRFITAVAFFIVGAASVYAQQFAVNTGDITDSAPLTSLPATPSIHGDVHLLTESELSQLTAINAKEIRDDAVTAFIISANPTRLTRLAWLPTNKKSYSINVPPLSKLVILSRNHHASKGTLLRGITNESRDWMRVTGYCAGTDFSFIRVPSGDTQPDQHVMFSR